MKTVILGILSLMLLGCAQGANDGKLLATSSYGAYEPIPDPTPSPSKPLAALWLRTDSNMRIDFTQAVPGEPFIARVSFNTGEQCACTILLDGGLFANSLQSRACEYMGGGPGDPTCSAFNTEMGSYSHSSGSLAIDRWAGGLQSFN